MKAKARRNTPRFTLHPLKAEEALAIFMRADPEKVAKKMRGLGRRGRGAPLALPKA